MDDLNIVLLVAFCALILVFARYASQTERKIKMLERFNDMHIASIRRLSGAMLDTLQAVDGINEKIRRMEHRHDEDSTN